MPRHALPCLALALAGIAAPAIAQYGGRPSATFYVKDGFGGRSVTVDRPIRSFREFDMNDKASSIALRGGPWLVCEDDDFRGRCTVVDRSIGSLARIGMDDRISSARPLDGRDNYGNGNGNAGRPGFGGGNGGYGNSGNGNGNYGNGNNRPGSGNNYPTNNGYPNDGRPGNGGGGGGNASGALPGGSWAASCRNAQVQNGVLQAQCNSGQGWQQTQITPRQCPTGRVGNRQGTLVCE